MLKGPLLVRGDLILRDELAVEYLEMLDKISEIVNPDGTWSRASLDDLLVESVLHVPLHRQGVAQKPRVRRQTASWASLKALPRPMARRFRQLPVG